MRFMLRRIVRLQGDMQQLWICFILRRQAFLSLLPENFQVPRPVYDDSFDVADFFCLPLPALRNQQMAAWQQKAKGPQGAALYSFVPP